mgnify:CR=1 FL=1
MGRKLGRQTASAAEATRVALLEAAMRQFARHGFQGASLRAIAADAGVSHGLIRHHFGSKEALWRAVVDDFVRRFEERHEPLLNRTTTDDPVALMRGFVTNFVQVSAEIPGLSRFLMNDCSQPGPRLDYLLERMAPIHHAIEPVFLAAQAQGLAPQHDPDTFFVFLLMVGAFPFSLRALSSTFYGEDIASAEGVARHRQLVLETLFR